MFEWIRRAPKCGICRGDLGKKPGVIKYRVADDDETHEMNVCETCGDALESGAISPKDIE